LKCTYLVSSLTDIDLALMAPFSKHSKNNSHCAAGRITWIAAQELVLEGKAEWYSANDSTVGALIEEHPESINVVDGCEKQCLYKDFLEEGLAGKHHLTLAGVGIAPLKFKDISREDIELAKDASSQSALKSIPCARRYSLGVVAGKGQ
jgi:uncharacterized metal-binding protein